MRFGKREHTAPEPETDPVTAFWVWWRTAAADLARAFDTGEVGDVAERVGPPVEAIEPGLAWEFGPGLHSRHQLTVTAAGNPELRAAARRWLRAAPAPDEVWSFYDSRQPAPTGAGLRIDGVEIALADVTVRAEAVGTGLDVVVHHPSFATLDEKGRAQIAYLLLDNAIGEELVELWLGRIETSPAPLEGAQTWDRLPERLAEVIAAQTEDGEMGWTLLRGEGPEGPVVALTRARLSAVQAPHLDDYVGVTVAYSDPTAEGWPGPGSLEALRALEDQLITAVGEAGMLAGHESWAGRRTLHFFVDSTLPGAALLQAAAQGWAQGEVGVRVEPDPAWAAVGHLRG